MPILAENSGQLPLAETEVETGEVTRELPAVVALMQKDPLLTIAWPYGEA